MVSAAGGATLLRFAYGVPFADGWEVLVSRRRLGPADDHAAPAELDRSDVLDRRPAPCRIQTLALSALVAVVGYFDFHDALPGLFLAFPFLLLTTFRGRLLGATTAAAPLVLIAIWSTFTGHGPIAAFAGTHIVARVQYLQLYIWVVLLSALPFAAVLEQREQLMAQLRKTTKAAQDAARAKSEFLAVMSHEIRTPMTGVLGMTDLLMQEQMPAKQRDYVARIRASGRHLLTLINDILDFSRIEAGRIELEEIDFDIGEVLAQVHSLLAPLAVERGLDLDFEADDRASPRRSRRPDQDQAGADQPGRQRHQVHPARRRDRHRLEPDDGGSAGALPFRSPRYRDRHSGGKAEDPLRPVRPSRLLDHPPLWRQRAGACDLAGASSRRWAGEIDVDSVEGIGSRFWFEIPLSVSEEAAPRKTLTPRIPDLPPQRVLLAEDVEMNRVVVVDMLRAHGHDVVTAANGQEAVDLVAREVFDVVLMDVQMPVMDGVEAAARIRQLPPPACDVPVIALSANVMAEDLARYNAAGMNGALTKPIDWPKLFDALAQHGSAGRMRSRAPGRSAPSSAEPVEISGAPEAEVPGQVNLAGFELDIRSLKAKLADFSCAMPANALRNSETRSSGRTFPPLPGSRMRSGGPPPILARNILRRSAPTSKPARKRPNSTQRPDGWTVCSTNSPVSARPWPPIGNAS